MNQPQGQPRLFEGPYDVSMGQRGTPPQPGRALVLSLANGSAVHVSERPGLWDSATKYSYRYEVDTGDYHHAWKETLPSSVGGYGFAAQVSARFRVTDPAKVVEKQIRLRSDAAALVAGRIRLLMRQASGRFHLLATAEAEAELNRTFGSREIPLDCGVTILAVGVELDLDAAARAFLRETQAIDWTIELGSKTHGKVMQKINQEHSIQSAQENNLAGLVAAREERLRQAATSEAGMIFHLIAQDPSQMRSILGEVGARRDLDLQRKQQIVKDLTANGFFQPADQDVVLQLLFPELGGNFAGVLGGPTAQALPAAPAPVSRFRQLPPGRDDTLPDVVEVQPEPSSGSDGVAGWTSFRPNGQGGGR